MFLKKENYSNLLLIILSIILFSYAALPFALVSISTFAFVATFFLINYKTIKKNLSERKRIRTFAITTVWLFFLFFTLSYSHNWDYGLKLILRCLSLILIFFIFIFGFTNKILLKSHFFYLSFILSNFIFTLFLYYKAIAIIEVSCYPQIYYSSFIDKVHFLFSKPNHIIFACFENEYKHSFFIHRVYNSINYLFSLFLIIHILWIKSIRILLKLLLIIIAIWFLFLIRHQLSIVNVFLTVFLIPIFILLKIKKKPTKRFKRYIGFLPIIIFCFWLFKFDDKVAINQIEPAVNMFKKMTGIITSGEIDDRFNLNKANKNLVFDKPLLGYGIGDVQDQLNNYYFNQMSSSDVYLEAYSKKLNSHNFYYFLLLSGGIILLLLYCCSYFFLIKASLNEKNLLHLFFLILFGVNLLFENVLYRIHGILLFSIFNGLFISKYLNKNEISE